MYSVTIKTLKEGKWKDIPLKQDQKEIWEQIKATAGTQSVVEIITERENKAGERFTIKEYYCGTEELCSNMYKVKKDDPRCCVVTTEDAIRAQEYNPDFYFTLVTAFFGPSDVEKQFPPKPKEASKKGWEHLREEE